MVSHIKSAEFFLKQNRIDDAEKALRQALAEDPNDAYALALLANCSLAQKKLEEAQNLIERAFSFEPNNLFIIHTLAQVYFYGQKTDRAKWAIGEGLKIAPDEAIFYQLQAQIALYEEKWQDALEASERGLELDPESVNLINLRAQALIKLNRKSEALDTIDYALHKAPEDSWSHMNKGWVSIEQDKYDDAIEQFKESLRLDPTNKAAKAGLKEAIKAKNPIYRLVLKYFLWMGKLQEKGRWGVVIGAYLIYRGVIWLNRSFPELSILLVPIIVFYISFAFATWIGVPISNLFLRFHPLGKLALSKDERIGSSIVGVIALISLTFLAMSFLSTDFTDFFFWLFAFTGIMLIPIGGLFAVTPQTNTRKGLIVYTLILAILGIVYTFNPAATTLLYVWAIGLFAFQFVASYLMSRDAKVLIRTLEE